MSGKIVFILLLLSALGVFFGSASGQDLVMQPLPDTLIFNEGDTISLHIIATYLPDSSLIRLTTNPRLPAPFYGIIGIFTDSSFAGPDSASHPIKAYGRGVLDWGLGFDDQGVYGITFYANVDSGSVHLVDSQHVTFIINGVNVPPELKPISDASVVEGEILTFKVIGSDYDETIVTLSSSAVPPNATFVDQQNDTAVFTFNPDYMQSGVYPITFYASDGLAVDSQTATITVQEAGNQRPVFVRIDSLRLRQDTLFQRVIVATDPDGTIPTLSIDSLPANASFVDSLNGHALFSMTPDSTQLTPFSVTFVASDGQLEDIMIVPIEVLRNNIPPDMDSIPTPRQVRENEADTFYIHATDVYLGQISYSIVPMPRNADTVRVAGDSLRFIFAPDYFQSGVYPIEFYARNAVNVDSQQVIITVLDVNRPPVLHATVDSTIQIDEKQTLSFLITVTDPDSTIDSLYTSARPANADFVDHGNDTATFTFTPSSRQSGRYDISFYAYDRQPLNSRDTFDVAIFVRDLAPLLTRTGSTSVREGRYIIDTLLASNNPGSLTTFEFSPPSSDTSYHGRVNFRQISHDMAVFMYFPDYYKVGPDTVETGNMPVIFSASSGIDTNFVNTDFVVANVHKDPNDTLSADTLTVTTGIGEWDGVGPVVLHAKIANDYGIAGALTAFRWFDTTLHCDSVVMNPVIFNPSDSSLYRSTHIYDDSLKFDCEFLFFDGKSLPPPGGAYFDAYFSYYGAWGPSLMLFFDSTKIGSTGDFIFDRRIRSMSRKSASREEFALSPENSFTYRPLLLIDQVLSVQPVDVTEPPEPVVPDKFSLDQNYPNPFNPSTTIKFSIARQSNVKMVVYNILGQEVAVLTDRGYPPGEYRIIWDGKDGNGIAAASGIYLYRIVADGISQTRKMILLK